MVTVVWKSPFIQNSQDVTCSENWCDKNRFFIFLHNLFSNICNSQGTIFLHMLHKYVLISLTYIHTTVVYKTFFNYKRNLFTINSRNNSIICKEIQ